jgi:hypothetical protein
VGAARELQEVTLNATRVTYTDKAFVQAHYEGLLQLTIHGASGLKPVNVRASVCVCVWGGVRQLARLQPLWLCHSCVLTRPAPCAATCAQITGGSDPYAVATLGDSAATTGVGVVCVRVRLCVVCSLPHQRAVCVPRVVTAASRGCSACGAAGVDGPQVQWGQLNPQWGETHTLYVPKAAGGSSGGGGPVLLKLRVLDKNKLVSDVDLGVVMTSLGPLLEAPGEKVTLPLRGVAALCVPGCVPKPACVRQLACVRVCAADTQVLPTPAAPLAGACAACVAACPQAPTARARSPCRRACCPSASASWTASWRTRARRRVRWCQSGACLCMCAPVRQPRGVLHRAAAACALEHGHARLRVTPCTQPWSDTNAVCRRRTRPLRCPKSAASWRWRWRCRMVCQRECRPWRQRCRRRCACRSVSVCLWVWSGGWRRVSCAAVFVGGAAQTCKL